MADGRILNGRKAKELNLIDETGFYQDAVDKAALLAGIEGEPEVKEFTPYASPFSEIFMSTGYGIGQGLAAKFTEKAFYSTKAIN